ncbi:hypothetical protein J2X32_003123 [Rheinheimera pacifica]|uniref:hypothetical protein n=1 Tax=Rheinheimera pacifica TaxID=173990 RepID=UPI002858BD80|nr:hypothetical protein [Rheinheimera pacifica]MDR6984479.1 hypothetical protein [Rheinheimera pacifica]
MKLFSSFIAVAVLIFPGVLLGATASGKITLIQLPLNNDVNTVYFQIDTTPEALPKFFYLRFGTGDSAGCAKTANAENFSRAYSALLAAHLANRSINIVYCLDSNGYGLVNQHIGVGRE